MVDLVGRQGSSGSLRLSWALWGPLGSVLGACWEGHISALLGRPGALLGCLGASVGGLGGLWGVPWCAFGVLLGYFVFFVHVLKLSRSASETMLVHSRL